MKAERGVGPIERQYCLQSTPYVQMSLHIEMGLLGGILLTCCQLGIQSSFDANFPGLVVQKGVQRQRPGMK